MALSVTHSDELVAVIGAGVMGRGIARVMAAAGVSVLLYDASDGAAASAVAELGAAWEAHVTIGRMAADDARAALSRVSTVTALSELQHATLVIEAIVEELAAKQALFSALEDVVHARCVLATNTSSLSVTAIAAACSAPERVVGLHFFNPVPAMKLVEVIDGARGHTAVGDAMMQLVTRIGHTPVRVRDTPGFLVNHAGRGYGTEALRIVSETVAAPHVIDTILREQAGFRLGPFELFDLVGLDVSVPVMESVYRQFFEEPRFRPSPLLVQRRTAGMLGVKSGEGFYAYVNGKREIPHASARALLDVGPIWVSDVESALAALARTLLTGLGATLETGSAPSARAIGVVTPIGDDVTSCCAREGLDATRTVALDMVFSNDSHRTLMLSPVTSPAVRAQMESLLSADGHGVSTIHDSTGLVAQRVVATIINIACDIAQQGIAAPADIDRAVTLALGYPRGPLAWGDALGAGVVCRILARMHALTGDPRYRTSPWLRRRAQLGLSLLHTADG
jgi:3-hydroxybutyryl-CoA dehydrogenase